MVPLFVCYLPGLDRRRIDPDITPTIHDLVTRGATVRIDTIPSTELLPTLVTGVYPHEHGIWQVSLKPDADRNGSRLDRLLLDHLPDPVVTTFQCMHHLVNEQSDLAAVPHRRLRQFNLHRLKYTRRQHDSSVLNEFNGRPSLFGMLGDQSIYRFTKRFDQMRQMAQQFPTPGLMLEFVEFYAFDLFSHWHLDQPEAIAAALHEVDQTVATLMSRCEQQGTRFMLLVDHGQEPIHDRIDLRKVLQRTGVPLNEYTYYMEVAATRLWFHTERARQAITEALAATPHVTLRDWRQMHDHHVCFEDERFGELYAFADHGHVFFPHDFYQPLANFYLGLSNPEQRNRMWNPLHRGNHGHLPDHPSENGYLVLADDRYAPAAEQMSLIDFAPTVLSLLGQSPPEHLSGRPMLQAR